jgi:hypothetical protein
VAFSVTFVDWMECCVGVYEQCFVVGVSSSCIRLDSLISLDSIDLAPVYYTSDVL